MNSFLNSAGRPKDWVAVRYKKHNSWAELTWQEYFEQGRTLALALLASGVQAGDRVAILANTRYEWGVLDFAILSIGGITVPIYQSQKAEEVEWLVNHAEPRILFVEDKNQYKKWQSIAKRCKSVEKVVVMDPVDELDEKSQSWDDFQRMAADRYQTEFETRAKAVRPEDMATIVYTSGTTGEPKGVILTHRQIVSEVEDLVKAYPISPGDSTLSFLPYAHVLGRVELWLHMFLGFTMTFAQGIDRLRSNLAEIKPTVILGVPRIFEKIYAGMIAQVEGQPIRQKMLSFFRKNSSWYSQIAADLLVFRKLREGLGGHLRFVVSGGAPLEPGLADFFRRAGILLLEGYGLTETSAAICVNTPESFEFGTVGKPLPDVQIRLADDGEILVKSDKVMKGYYKNPGESDKVFIDGFFATGDIGIWTDSGFLKITDRKKDLIKTAGGKYVAPQKLENLLKLNPLISHALIHGDRKKYIVALLTLDEAYVKRLAKSNGWSFKDYETLVRSQPVMDLARQAVAEVNSQLSSFETIKSFAIVPHDFTIEGGELTPSLKVKRKYCDQKYAAEIAALY
ncbi:MAG: long-chain fatty acid--CoA ligase [Bdellovibrionales bacterium]